MKVAEEDPSKFEEFRASMINELEERGLPHGLVTYRFADVQGYEQPKLTEFEFLQNIFELYRDTTHHVVLPSFASM